MGPIHPHKWPRTAHCDHSLITGELPQDVSSRPSAIDLCTGQCNGAIHC